MDIHASVDARCGRDRLLGLVDDLSTYPQWIDLVHAAEPDGDDDGCRSWRVELRARVGPLARSKRLRMSRVVHEPDRGLVVFERRELDARRHSPWVLRVEVGDTGPSGSTVRMHLHYGGALWAGGLLERVLADQIEDGRRRLAALAAA